MKQIPESASTNIAGDCDIVEAQRLRPEAVARESSRAREGVLHVHLRRSRVRIADFTSREVEQVARDARDLVEDLLRREVPYLRRVSGCYREREREQNNCARNGEIFLQNMIHSILLNEF